MKILTAVRGCHLALLSDGDVVFRPDSRGKLTPEISIRLSLPPAL